MAARLLHSLTDDNLDLQRHIGCMTGISQLFDRHHILSARRISQRKLPSPGNPLHRHMLYCLFSVYAVIFH